MSAMKACFQIAECSLSSAKIMPMSAMKACFQIAECSLSSAKIALLSVTEDHSDVKKNNENLLTRKFSLRCKYKLYK